MTTRPPAPELVKAVARAMAYVIAKRHAGRRKPSESEVLFWLSDARRKEARAAIAAYEAAQSKEPTK